LISSARIHAPNLEAFENKSHHIKRVFGSVVVVAFQIAFQIAFRAEIHADDVFSFFKNYF
jgi:hypothetical protein